jgi:poly(3-hydroxybutyrate) depolymerase
MVIFFHGLGERGTNNTSQVNGNIDNLVAAAKSRKFYIYAPQLSTNWTYWHASFVDNALRKAEEVPAKYKVDKSRVYVTGLSLGGGGVWSALSRYTGAVAAGVSICGVDPTPGLTSVDYTNLVGKAIWSFHAGDDSTAAGGVSPSKSRNRVNGIRNAIGLTNLVFPPAYTNGSSLYTNAPAIDTQRYTEYQSGGHGIWGTVYGTSALYDWWMGTTNVTTQVGQSLPLASTSLQEGETMLFDFGSTQKTTDGGGQTWNSTASNYYDTLAAVLPFARTAQGRMTTISLVVTQAFSGQTTNGSTALYESGIGSDGWQTDSVAKVLLQGLIPSIPYQIEFYGATSTAGRMTQYQIGGQTAELNASGNTTATVQMEVVADNQGRIEVAVQPKPGVGSAGQINTLKLWRSAVGVLAQWRQLQGLAADGSEDLGTPAGDNVANLIKYALNLAPQAGDLSHPASTMAAGGTAGLPRTEIDGTGRLIFSWVRRKAATNPGITYSVEKSTDLVTWQPESSTPGVESIDSSWERMTYTVDPAGTPRTFLRLKIQRP